MKAYKVTVNGNVYEITLEVIDKADIKAAPAAAGSQSINSPMPGTILKVNVQNGQSVKKGDVLMVLEAMKMENEIMAPKAGTIAQVVVSKGSSVNTGDVLIVVA